MIENKFGVKFPNYFEEHELLLGYGESVGYLVDDLLNRELIRRDYKFAQPIFPNDNDDSDDLEEAKIEDDNQLVFESNIQTKQDSPTRRQKIIAKNASVVENGKVTRTNFFSADSNIRTQADEDLNDFNDSMISGKVDPAEWQAEVEKVKPQLVLIEKEQYKINFDPLEEFLMHLEKTITLMKAIKEEGSKDSVLQTKLSNAIGKMSSDIDYIMREERRMNNK